MVIERSFHDVWASTKLMLISFLSIRVLALSMSMKFVLPSSLYGPKPITPPFAGAVMAASSAITSKPTGSYISLLVKEVEEITKKSVYFSAGFSGAVPYLLDPSKKVSSSDSLVSLLVVG